MNVHLPLSPFPVLRFLRAAALALALLASPFSASSQTYNWTGNGASTNANNVANWSPGSPGNNANADIFFNNATGHAIMSFNPGGDFTWKSITFNRDGDFTINYSANAGTLGTAGGGITATASGTTLRTYSILDEFRVAANQTWSTTNQYSRLVVQQATGNLALGANTLTLDTFNHADATIRISSAISGTGGIIKSGGGTATLNGTNTYTGTTTLNAGQLNINSATAIGNGTFTINGGTIDNTSGAAITLTNNRPQNWNGDFAFTGTRDLNLGTGAVTMNASRTVTVNGGNLTVGGAIAGTGFALTKNGIGTMILTGANTYNGTTTINAGTLQLANVNALQNTTLDTGASGSQAVTFSVAGANTYNIGAIQGGDTLDFGNNTISVGANNASTSFTGTLAGSGGSLTKGGTGTLTLSGASSSYDGTTTISAGTIQIDHANALGSGGNITFSGGGLKYGTGITEDLSSRIKNSASAILVDTTGESVAWGTALDSTNSGGLTKNGAGTLTLSASNTYSGATTINAGTLQIDGNIANSGLVINSGGIISPGTTAAADSFGTSSITINGGGYIWTLSSANGSAGTGYDQITSTGALTSSGVLTVNIYGNATGWDNAANYSWDIFSAASLSGSFNSSNFAYTVDTNFNGGVTPTGTFTFSNPDGTGIIRITYTAATDPVWAGGTGNWTTGFSANVTNGANIAFAGASGGTATNNIPTGTLTTMGDIEFRSSAGAYTLAADAGSAGASGGTALTVNGSITNNSTATQTINTNLDFAATRTIAANTGNITIGGEISGAGGLTKNGSNKLTLTAANTYTGDTTINTGTLEIGSGSTTGSLSSSSAITNNANLVFNRSNDLTVSNTIGGTGNLTKSGAGTLTLSGNSTYSGTTTISDGALRATHANALGSTAAGTTVASGAALELSGGISIGAEALSLAGTGISSGGALRNISGNNSYAGAITLAAATLINSDSGNLTLSGIMSGSNALTKNGSGTLTLSATNTYTGGTTINGGTLAFTDGTTSAIGNGTITINNGSTLSLNKSQFYSQSIIFGSSGGGNLTTTFNGIRFSGSTISTTGGATNFISGSTIDISTPTFNVAEGTDDVDLQVSNFIQRGGITKSGAGKLLLTNNNAFNVGVTHYTITINAGALEIGATGRLVSGSYSGNITNNGIFIYSGTNAQTLSGIISGTGALTQNASSTLTLSGNNTYSGTTTISDGTIVIGATGRLGAGSYAGAISNNGTLIYSGTNDQTLSGIISGTGALTKNAASTLTLTNANTYSGGTTLNTGTLVIGNTAAAGSASINQTSGSSLLKIDTTGTITNAMSVYNVQASQSATLSGAITVNNATWEVDAGDTLTISGNLGGDGGTTKNGTGTLLLSGNNSNTGATTVNAGTLTAASANALGSTSSVVVSNSGSLLVTAGDSINDSAAVTLAGGTLAVNGTFNESVGLLTLSANSIIDLNGFTGTLQFGGVGSWASDTTLAIWNWNGTNRYGTPVGDGANNRHVVFTSNTGLGDYLGRISFYSDSGTSFAGNGFEQGFSGGGTEIIPVPEPETWATGILLVLSSGIWLRRKRTQAA